MPVLTVSEEFQEGLVTLDVPKFLAARPQCPSRRIPCCWVRCKFSQRPASGRCCKQSTAPTARSFGRALARPWKSKAGAAVVLLPLWKLINVMLAATASGRGVMRPVVHPWSWRSRRKSKCTWIFSLEIPSISLAFGYTAHHHHPSLFSSRSAWSLGSFPVRKSASTTWFVSLLATSCMQICFPQTNSTRSRQRDC